MPELPEVEVVRAGLEPALRGATVRRVDVVDGRSLKRHDARRGDFAPVLTGQRILRSVRRGKFLWFPLSGGDALVGHLGMSGQLLLRSAGVVDPLTRIAIELDSPAGGELVVNFADQRRFGSLALDALVDTADRAPGGDAGADVDAAVVPSQVGHIARDPLDPAFERDAVIERLGRGRRAIKAVLLDQGVVSGIGNIYADEALWAASVHFATPAERVPRASRAALLDAVVAVLQRALAEGGTSFDSQYVDVNGRSGYFSRSLQVYGRQGEPCRRCGTAIVRVPFANRSSHLCPACQEAG